jgi:N-acetylneuraminic acid mutarotase
MMLKRYFVPILFLVVSSMTVQAQWSELKDYPGALGTSGIAFSIGDRIFAGMGANSGQLWEYIPSTDTWVKRKDIPGGARAWGIAFEINGKGYVGTGDPQGALDGLKDFWEYDADLDEWTQKADYAFMPRIGMWHFVVDGIAYVGGGYNGLGIYNDVAKYDPVADEWTWVGYWPGGNVRLSAAFAVDGKGYVGTGSPGSFGQEINSFYEFNPNGNTWTRKADFPGGPRQGVVGFVAGGKGYFGCGQSGSSITVHRDFYGYDPNTDTWEKLQGADFPIGAASWLVQANVNNTIYAGLGTVMPGFAPSARFYKLPFGSLLEASVKNSTLDMGSLLIGTMRDSTVSFTNKGSEALTISSMSIENDADAVFSLDAPALPYELAQGATVDAMLHFLPATEKSSSAILRLVSDVSSGSPLDITLIGEGRKPQAQITLDPVGIDFGSVAEGSTHEKSFDIRNTGIAPLIVTDLIIINDISAVFSILNFAAPVTVLPGESESINVKFSPSSDASFSAQIKITSNAFENEEVMLNLSGVGSDVSRRIELSTNALSIEGVEVGTYGEEDFTLSSIGDGPLTISNIAIENDPDGVFSVEGLSLPVTIQAGANESFTVRFTPEADGTKNASLKIISNADNGTQKSISLTGIGFVKQTSAISVSETTIDFGSVEVDKSEDRTFAINSVGASSLKVTSIMVDGDPNNVFELGSISTPFTLIPGGKKNVQISFAPTVEGDFSATILIESDAPGSESVSVSLNGKAMPKDFSDIDIDLSLIAFDKVVLNTNKSTNLTIRSSGTLDLMINSISIDGMHGSVFSYSGITSPHSIKAGESSNLALHFMPSAAGEHEATLHLTTNVPGSEQIDISLRGTGTTATSLDDLSPRDIELISLYPNPLPQGQSLFYSYSDVKPVQATLSVYDALGRELLSAHNMTLNPGPHRLVLPAQFRTGVYFISVQVGTRKNVLPVLVSRP